VTILDPKNGVSPMVEILRVKTSLSTLCRGKYLSVCSQIPGGSMLKNGGFGEEFLVKITQILLEKATFEAFGAIHEKV